MCKITSEKKKQINILSGKKSTNVRRGIKKDVILNKILICSDTEHSKVERNKIISIIIMESQLDKKNFFFFFF